MFNEMPLQRQSTLAIPDQSANPISILKQFSKLIPIQPQSLTDPPMHCQASCTRHNQQTYFILPPPPKFSAHISKKDHCHIDWRWACQLVRQSMPIKGQSVRTFRKDLRELVLYAQTCLGKSWFSCVHLSPTLQAIDCQSSANTILGQALSAHPHLHSIGTGHVNPTPIRVTKPRSVKGTSTIEDRLVSARDDYPTLSRISSHCKLYQSTVTQT